MTADLVDLPTELVDGILSIGVHATSAQAGMDVDQYQSNIVAVVNVHFRDTLRQTHATALARMPWIMDLDLLCSKQHPLSVLKWVHLVARLYHPKLYLHWSHGVIEAASAKGHIDVLDWFFETFGQQLVRWFCITAIRAASEGNPVDVLEWWWKKCRTTIWNHVSESWWHFLPDVAKAGSLDALKWWICHGLTASMVQGKTVLAAIEGKHWPVLRWIEEQVSVTFDRHCVLKAAEAGDLDLFKYVFGKYHEQLTVVQQDIKARDFVPPQLVAANGGQFHILEWLQEQNKLALPPGQDRCIIEIAQNGSVKAMEWWLDHYDVQHKTYVKDALMAAYGKLDLMQLLLDRFPEIASECAYDTPEPNNLDQDESQDEGQQQAPFNFAVLEWWENRVLRASGLASWNWPTLVSTELIVEACRRGNVDALQWMFTADPSKFILAIKSRYNTGDDDKTLMQVIGEGGNPCVVKWWLRLRLPICDMDFAYIVQGAVNCSQWAFLDWITAESEFDLDYFDSEEMHEIFPQWLGQVADHALTNGNGQGLEWLLQHVDGRFSLTAECLTVRSEWAQVAPCNRITFQALLCIRHLLEPNQVGLPETTEHDEWLDNLLSADKGFAIAHLIHSGQCSLSSISCSTLIRAARSGKLSFLDWVLHDAALRTKHLAVLKQVADEQESYSPWKGLADWLSSSRFL